MLADIVEASSRTLVDPSPASLAQHIDGIMKNVYSSGQLDQCNLTLRDLRALTDSFNQMLLGLHHQRISYQPPQDKSAPFRPPAVKPAEDAESGLPVRGPVAESAVTAEHMHAAVMPGGSGSRGDGTRTRIAAGALPGGSGETGISGGRRRGETVAPGRSKVIRMKSSVAQFGEADVRHS
jgi:hypothetical protein